MCALRSAMMALPANKATSYRLNHNTIPPMKNIARRGKPIHSMPTVSDCIDTLFEDEISHSPANVSDEEFVFSSDDEGERANTCTSSKEMVNPALTVYAAACKQNKVLPIACVNDGLVQEVLACKNIHLKKAELRAICTALAASYMVDKAIFEHNGIGDIGVPILGEIVRGSLYLTQICIRANDLKSNGARIMCDAVKHNYSIKVLDLSANGFVESDGHYFKSLLEECNSLRELNLSNNCLSEKGVELIAQGLRKNKSLYALDLSWNHIRRMGATAVGDALVCNTGLENLNLAWNGLHMEGAKATAKALTTNATLLGLDLTCNRMSDMCMMELMKGLEKNTKLQILRIGNNQVTSNGALAILKQFKSHTASGITLLDLGRVEVHDTFEKLHEELREERDLQVVYGMVWSTKRGSLGSFDQCDDEAALSQCDPLIVLMECMRLQNFRLTDYFKDIDTIGSSKNSSSANDTSSNSNNSNNDSSSNNKGIGVNELCEGLLKLNVPLNRVTLMKLLASIAKDESKVLDFEEMISAQREHTRKVRALKPQDNGYTETDIGKVSMHLKRMMGKQFTVNHRVNETIASSQPASRTSSSVLRQNNKKQAANRKNMWDSYSLKPKTQNTKV